MVDFFIISNKVTNSYFEEWNKISFSKNQYLYSKNKDYYTYKVLDKTIIIIGDCINTEIIESSDSIDINLVVNTLKGNFYAFIINNDGIIITSSAFGLLPIYYKNDYSIISSSVDYIRELSDVALTEDKRWIINYLLFNYQFFNDTFYNEIKLFPAFSYLIINKNNYTFNKYFDVGRYFVKKPKTWKKSINNLSNLFIEVAGKYIPKNDSIISFTGGFDGRTLVAVATHFKRKFETFSYGKFENDDVYIPFKNSKELGIPYFFLNLDKQYSEKGYLESSLEYIKNTNGANGFLYAHVDYSAKKIKDKSSYLISGVCGSELFRAAHSSGAVTSKALINLFKYNSFEEYKTAVYNSDVFRYIDKHEFENEIQEVVKQAWNYKINLPTTLSKNQKLYVFVYEEIFRKFFGTWITAQMKYVNVRTPFIDFEFFKELIKTELSGAYSDFLTENPLKRFKGQVLYAEIIKKTNRTIYSQKTGKGYAPKIVREPLLRPFLLLPFLTKRFKRKVKQENLDNLGIVTGIENYVNKKEYLINSRFFNELEVLSSIQSLTSYTKETKRDLLLTILSISNYTDTL